MKIRVTQKAIKNAYKYVICVPYCGLQRALSKEMPFGYTTRREGWASDIYGISPDVAISTGYAPFGNIRPERDLIVRYEVAAEKILCYYNFDGAEAKLERRMHALIDEFVAEALVQSK